MSIFSIITFLRWMGVLKDSMNMILSAQQSQMVSQKAASMVLNLMQVGIRQDSLSDPPYFVVHIKLFGTNIRVGSFQMNFEDAPKNTS